jgi:hypothetical protein
VDPYGYGAYGGAYAAAPSHAPAYAAAAAPPPPMGGPPAATQQYCLFVYNLPPSSDDNYLYRLFSPYGALFNVKLVRDLATGTCKVRPSIMHWF